MSYRPQTNFRKPTRTKVGQKIALMQCIMHRDDFSEAAVESLARGFGHGPDEVRAMIADELARREARRVA